MSHTSVSIIVATRNRQQLLERTLDGLIRQRWPRDRFEIIVADNASTDGTAAAVGAAAARSDAPPIRYLYVAEPGKSHAVNHALPAARGDVLAFTDDDVQPGQGWLEQLTTALDETGADFVAGRVLPDWEVPPPSWVSPALHGVLAIPDNGDERLGIEHGVTSIVPIGANMAVRAAVIAHVGGLRVDLGKLAGTLRTGEDHELFLRMMRAGYRGVYEPAAIVRHWVPRARLERGYCRRWLYQNGRDVARLEASEPPPIPRLFGVPRYLWRQGAVDAWSAGRATLAGDPAARFASAVRVLWLSGYVRESWFGRRSADIEIPLGAAAPDRARATRSEGLDGA